MLTNSNIKQGDCVKRTVPVTRVYDWETGFYYLQSRYYDPMTGRFISADVLLSTGQGVLGHNCYAYCLGDPVMMVDDGGNRPAKGANNPDGDTDGRKDDEIRVSSTGIYNNADDAAIAIAPILYYCSQATNLEFMSPIYRISFMGEANYIVGPISPGFHNNVIPSTIGAYIEDVATGFDNIELVGFVHSHPYCDGHAYSIFSGWFGDQGAAYLTGSCYLIQPENRTLYKITRKDVLDRKFANFTYRDMKKYRRYTYSSLIPYEKKYSCKNRDWRYIK